MARPRRAKQEESPEEPRLTVPRPQLEQALNIRIELGRQLEQRPIGSLEKLEEARADYYTWTEYNETLLRRSFTTGAVADQYRSIGPSVGWDKTLGEDIDDFREDVRNKVRRLKSIVERLPLYDDEMVAARPEQEASSRTTIFIVHGRAEAPKLAVHGFLREVTSVEVVILHDQASEGRTIIEKFEDHADTAAFAVVIMTGDDEARIRDGKEGELRPRARQNVIFEYGFFVAALGRRRVAVLYEEGAELPSDVAGLVYIPLDSAGAWKLLLARELNAADVSVDAQKMLSG